MFNLKLIFTLIFIITISGCASSAKNIDTSYELGKNPKESILIMGINRNFRVTFVDGQIIEEDLFVIDSERSTGSMIQPQNGYIIMPALLENDYSTHYGIHGYLQYGLIFQAWIPCEDDPILAFEIPEGEIGYIGDFSFEVLEDGSLHYPVHYEMEKLKNFLKINYPNIADKTIHKIELEKYRYNYGDDSCVTEIHMDLPRYD